MILNSAGQLKAEKKNTNKKTCTKIVNQREQTLYFCYKVVISTESSVFPLLLCDLVAGTVTFSECSLIKGKTALLFRFCFYNVQVKQIFCTLLSNTTIIFADLASVFWLNQITNYNIYVHINNMVKDTK
jgi:hypothetical protein